MNNLYANEVYVGLLKCIYSARSIEYLNRMTGICYEVFRDRVITESEYDYLELILDRQIKRVGGTCNA